MSTFLSRRSLLPSTLPAAQTDTANRLERVHLKDMPEWFATGASVFSGAAPQRAGAASSGLVVWKNPLPRPTKSPAYQLDSRHGPCHVWEGGASTERDWNAYSTDPGAEFSVSRRRT